MNHPAQPLIAPTASEAESHIRLKKGVRTAQLRRLLDEANEAFRAGLNDPGASGAVDWDARLQSFESRRRKRWGVALLLVVAVGALAWSQLTPGAPPVESAGQSVR